MSCPPTFVRLTPSPAFYALELQTITTPIHTIHIALHRLLPPPSQTNTIAKPPSTDSKATTAHHEKNSNAKDSASHVNMAPGAKPNHHGKGWEMMDYSPVPSALIIGDPTAPENIIHGKRRRKAVRIIEAQTGKVSRTSKIKDNGCIKKAEAKARTRRSAKVPAPARREKTTRACTRDEATAADVLRSSILRLVNQSLQVAEHVASYMAGHAEHEGHGRELERDVPRCSATGRRGNEARIQRGEM